MKEIRLIVYVQSITNITKKRKKWKEKRVSMSNFLLCFEQEITCTSKCCSCLWSFIGWSSTCHCDGILCWRYQIKLQIHISILHLIVKKISHNLSNFDWLGSLDKLLYDSNVKLSEEDKFRLIQGIASGMLHLHKHNIVHRDLAARNILLTESRQPKISVLFLFCVCFSLIHWFISIFLCHFSFLLKMWNRLKLTIDTNSFLWIDCCV
jgi:serine/threonine protein kinase